MTNKIFFLCGNARTFLACFDSTYENIISKLFQDNNINNTYILFYLKCDDPGPKGQENWNFTYEPIDINILRQEIEKYTKKYKNIMFYSRLLVTNEITDNEIFSQVKDRKQYIDFLSDNQKLLRALHCFYNMEQCGRIIQKIQIEKNIEFDYFIYIRPDLLFSEPCNNISSYNSDKITLGKGPNIVNNDHIAIIPKKYFYDFFFARMQLIRTNTTIPFDIYERIYWHTIANNFEVKSIGGYVIKR